MRIDGVFHNMTFTFFLDARVRREETLLEEIALFAIELRGVCSSVILLSDMTADPRGLHGELTLVLKAQEHHFDNMA
jgi:hypothetical protein